MAEQNPSPEPQSDTSGDRRSTLLSIAIVAAAILWAFDVPRLLGFVFITEQFLALIIGLSLALVFLTIDHRRNPLTGRPPAADWLLVGLSLAITLFLAARFPVLSQDVFYHPTEAAVLGTSIILLVIEGLRRMAGWPLVIIVLIFLIYGFAGHIAPAPLTGRYMDPVYLSGYLALDSNALVGIPLAVGAEIIIPFIFFGQLLRLAGGTRFFTDLAVALMGGFRGGAAKISVVASSLFGSISGSAVSNVVSTGVITIPLMKASGYRPRQAAAIEATASTGGQLMPPIMGAAAFLMAEMSQTPYTDVVIAALIPALLYYFTVFLQVDFDAQREGLIAVKRSERPKLRPTLISGWHYVLPFIVLIVALFSFDATPQRAALYAAATLFAGGSLFGYKGTRLRLPDCKQAVRDTGLALREILMIVAAAGLVIGVLNITGLVFILANILIGIGGESLFLLLLIAAFISIVLGMGMPTAGVYVLLATLVAPALTQSGTPKIGAHLFVLYFGLMSMITPPIAIAAFSAASLARADALGSALTAVRYAWSAYVVPFIFIFSPGLLLIGSGREIISAIATTAGGIWVITSAVNGYFLGKVTPAFRGFLFLAGLALIMPAHAFPGWSARLHAAGLLLGAGALLWRLGKRRYSEAR